MLKTEQKSSRLYKQYIGVADTRTSRDFYEEAVKSSFYVRPDQLLKYGDQIPNESAPEELVKIRALKNGQTYAFTKGEGDTVPIIKYYEDYKLAAVDSGTDSAFKLVDENGEVIKNIIPFNYCSDVYNYSLKTADGKKIYFGVGDWVLDIYSGVLTFYGDVPPGVDHLSPPTLSFYQYIGGTGFRQDPIGYEGAVLPIDNWHISKNTYLIDSDNDGVTLEEKVSAMASLVEPNFTDTYGFDGADDNEGIAYSFQKIISLKYTSSGDIVKGHDLSKNSEIGTLLSRKAEVSAGEVKVTFVSANTKNGKHTVTIDNETIKLDNGPAKTYKLGTTKLSDSFGNFIVIEISDILADGSYDIEVAETTTSGIMLYWDITDQEYLPYKSNEDNNYNFGFPVVTSNGKIPPSVSLGNLTASYNDSITPDYYGPRSYSVVVASIDTPNNKSADYIVKNSEGYYLEDIVKQIKADYTNSIGELKFSGTIFLRAGNYEISSILNMKDFSYFNIIGDVAENTKVEGNIILGSENKGLATLQNLTATQIIVNSKTQDVIVSNVIADGLSATKNNNNLFIKDSSIESVGVLASWGDVVLEEGKFCNRIVNSIIRDLDVDTGYTFLYGNTIEDVYFYDVQGDVVKGCFIRKSHNKPAQTNIWDSTVIEFINTPFSQIPHMAHFPIYAKSSTNMEYATFAAPFVITYDSENGNKINLVIDEETLEITDDGALKCIIKADKIYTDPTRFVRNPYYEGPQAWEQVPDGNLQGILEHTIATKADLNPNGKVPLEQLPDSVAYGGLLLVGTHSFEVKQEDGTYVDGGPYPTYEQAKKNLTEDQTQDGKIMPGWFWIVSSSMVDEDKPAAIQKAALQDGEENPIEFTAGDWIIWNGKNFEKLDRAYQDVAYMVLPIYTTGEHLCWSWKDSVDGTKNGLGALALGGETIAEAFDKVNQELRKLWVKHPALLSNTTLEPFYDDYKTISYFDISTGTYSPLKCSYDLHKDSRISEFRAKTPDTEPKWKSGVFVGDGCTFVASTDGADTELEYTPSSSDVTVDNIHVSAVFDPYENEMVGSGYWNAVTVDFTKPEEVEAGEHKYRLAISKITPDTPEFYNAKCGTDVLSFEVVKPFDLSSDTSVAKIDPTLKALNSNDISKALDSGMCSGIKTITKDIKLIMKFTIINAVDMVASDGKVIEIYDECHDTYTFVPMGNMKFIKNSNGMYDVEVSGFEYDFAVDKAYRSENFGAYIYDVYGNKKKLDGSLFELKFPISSISEKERVYSGTGLAPTYNTKTDGMCGYPFDSSKDLFADYPCELMKLGRVNAGGDTVFEYQWPKGTYLGLNGESTSYAGTSPADAIGDDDYRWVTLTKFKKDDKFETITMNEASGFTMKINVSPDVIKNWGVDKYSMSTENVIIQAILFDPSKDIDQESCSWVDCNTPYDGFATIGEQPNQAGMYAGSSNALTKRVTFGKDIYSGRLAIRIGIKRNSNLSFESVSIEDII